VIFCRNVLIYFGSQTKAGIFAKLARMLEPDGVLALGAAEIRGGITERIQALSRTARLYQPSSVLWPAPTALRCMC